MFSFKSCKTARLITLVCYQVWGFGWVCVLCRPLFCLRFQLSEGFLINLRWRNISTALGEALAERGVIHQPPLEDDDEKGISTVDTLGVRQCEGDVRKFADISWTLEELEDHSAEKSAE